MSAAAQRGGSDGHGRRTVRGVLQGLLSAVEDCVGAPASVTSRFYAEQSRRTEDDRVGQAPLAHSHDAKRFEHDRDAEKVVSRTGTGQRRVGVCVDEDSVRLRGGCAIRQAHNYVAHTEVLRDPSSSGNGERHRSSATRTFFQTALSMKSKSCKRGEISSNTSKEANRLANTHACRLRPAEPAQSANLHYPTMRDARGRTWCQTSTCMPPSGCLSTTSWRICAILSRRYSSVWTISRVPRMR